LRRKRHCSPYNESAKFAGGDFVPNRDDADRLAKRRESSETNRSQKFVVTSAAQCVALIWSKCELRCSGEMGVVIA